MVGDGGERAVAAPTGEEIILLPSPAGRICGVLHPPRGGRSRTALLFLNSGLQNRAGPQRLYVRAARRLSERGFASLRIDLPGVGDSEGEHPATHFDCYDPADVRPAIDWMVGERGIERVVLLGLCAGARVAFRTAVADRRVDAVIAWGLPVLSAPPNMPGSRQVGAAAVSDAAARDYLRRWTSKLLSPTAWKRYFGSGETLGGGLKLVWSVGSRLLWARRRSPAGGSVEFPTALDGFLRSGRRALFAYGELDRLPLAEFRHRFPSIAEGHDPLRPFVVVPAAGHTFTTVAAADEVISVTADWLAQNYG